MLTTIRATLFVVPPRIEPTLVMADSFRESEEALCSAQYVTNYN